MAFYSFIDLGLVDPGYALEYEYRLASKILPYWKASVIKWRSYKKCFVIGRSQKVTDELKKESFPCVLKRRSGGGTIYLDEGVVSIALIVHTPVPTFKKIDILYEVMLDEFVKSLNNEYCCFERINKTDIVFGEKKHFGSAGLILKNSYMVHFTSLLYANLEWALDFYKPLKELLSLHKKEIDPRKHIPGNLLELDKNVSWNKIIMSAIKNALPEILTKIKDIHEV